MLDAQDNMSLLKNSNGKHSSNDIGHKGSSLIGEYATTYHQLLSLIRNKKSKRSEATKNKHVESTMTGMNEIEDQENDYNNDDDDEEKEEEDHGIEEDEDDDDDDQDEENENDTSNIDPFSVHFAESISKDLPMKAKQVDELQYTVQSTESGILHQKTSMSLKTEGESGEHEKFNFKNMKSLSDMKVSQYYVCLP